ncbi:MAG: class II fructose-bisphosphatase [Candidatus Latescibacteria bacterium]|nr:class II fructose-bisphosphatase [bacterium]MBD3423903.1 class II fructose-bisphosphatase [Candidatus Latescibacterota bacterium]
MDRNLALEMVRVTEAAALAAARFLGKGNPVDADHAAVSAMATAIKGVAMKGRIVIGESPDKEQALLYPGCFVGSGDGTRVDIALDALDCRKSLINGRPNAISALAMGLENTFLEYPSPFMKMIGVGAEAAGNINLKNSVFDNLVKIAGAKREYVEDLTVAVLNRERHTSLIEEVRGAGARIVILDEGDLSAAISTGIPKAGIDVIMGTGSSAQGIIAAAALRCLGGDFQGKFIHPKEIELEEDDSFSLKSCSERFSVEGKNIRMEDQDEDISGQFEKVYSAEEIVSGDNVMFATTGVSQTPFLKGTIFKPGGALTHSMVLRSKSGTIRFLRTQHFFDKTPDYS